jgi:FkbM family methyltransferase
MFETSPLISYAQNFEDVILWRALKHIKNGFYIDIGAWLPDTDSVTKAFYDNGWYGINIEPDSIAFCRLLEERPRDINLQLAVSDKRGEADLYIIKDTGLSTLRYDIVDKHPKAGYSKSSTRIQVRTLNDIWAEFVPVIQDVHFLKIDVEGLEEAVIRGNNWSRYRPWIIVVEVTLPNSQLETHEDWERVLLSADYHFAYADGLNRFYVADEQSDLLPAFKYPPNVFDHFKPNAQNRAEADKQRAEVDRQRAESEQHRAKAQLTAERERSQGLEHELQSVYSSWCWRINAPLRAGFDLLLRVKAIFVGVPQAFRRSMGAIISPILDLAIRFGMRHPLFKVGAMDLLRRFPKVEGRIYRFALARGLLAGKGATSYGPPMEVSRLTPSARRIYSDLKDAFEKQGKKV